MKKIFVLLFTVLMLLGAVCGCNSSMSPDNMLLSVVNNKQAFLDKKGNSIYLNDYEFSYEGIDIIPEKYVLTDMDGDKTNELILLASPENVIYIVFHVYDDKVYGYEFNARSLIDLKEDGTFIQSEGTQINTYASITFENDKYKIRELAYENSHEKVYRISGVNVSLNDIEEYGANWNRKNSVDWINL